MNDAQGNVRWSPIQATHVRDRLAYLLEGLGPLKNTDTQDDGTVVGFMPGGIFVCWTSTNEICARTVGSPIRDVPDAVIERISRLVLTFAGGYTLTASRT